MSTENISNDLEDIKILGSPKTSEAQTDIIIDLEDMKTLDSPKTSEAQTDIIIDLEDMKTLDSPKKSEAQIKLEKVETDKRYKKKIQKVIKKLKLNW
jgi:hypothetical protein